MIVTVTLNPALDITYEVPGLSLDATNRVSTVAVRAGGKGINVARVIRAVGGPGTDVMAVTFAAGRQGAMFRALLERSDDLGRSSTSGHVHGLGRSDEADGLGQPVSGERPDGLGRLSAEGDGHRDGGVPHELIPIGGEIRRTLAVVDTVTNTVTMLNEPGPVIAPHEWAELCDRVHSLLSHARVLVLSGSLPPGVPGDAYAVLTRMARQAGALVVLDAGGEALRAALPERPDVVKPNAVELAAAIGLQRSAEQSPGDGWLAEAVHRVRAEGARCVIASDGPRGLWAATSAGLWRATPPQVDSGNPTGAGDAVVAVLALGLSGRWHGCRTPEALAEGRHDAADGSQCPDSHSREHTSERAAGDERTESWSWPHLLRHATALSAAAVQAPLAGEVDMAIYRANLQRVVVSGPDQETGSSVAATLKDHPAETTTSASHLAGPHVAGLPRTEPEGSATDRSASGGRGADSPD
ncbi:1-phosphofructokinase family hexose kinase [Sinosporangium siamense]|uniref:1-phosphofructokinase family hexose kinase n=1 Tax=Sinosporangium siamense TaxID=1367973 RepID=UPI001950DB0F|nr:1-phosphofructokinase family hexose kinase [Sinosporangium siamense]